MVYLLVANIQPVSPMYQIQRNLESHSKKFINSIENNKTRLSSLLHDQIERK